MRRSAAGCELTSLRRGGAAALRFLRRRRGCWRGCCWRCAGLMLLSSLFVWQIEVRGAERLSRGEILRALEDCGLAVGSFWPGLDTERLRSEMQLRCPGIGWMSVNVSGSRAVVLVVEREEKPLWIRDGAGGAGCSREGSCAGSRSSRAGGGAGGQVVTEGETLAAGHPNLYFSSGKAIDGCDKIVSEYTLWA